MSYVRPHEATKYYDVSDTTLRKWAEHGKIEYKTTDGGHRRYKIPDPDEDGTKIIKRRRKIIYARVSSVKQQKDLQRQIKAMSTVYPEYEVVSDIGSGINFERR